MDDPKTVGNKCFFDKKYEQAFGYYSEAIVGSVCPMILCTTIILTVYWV